MAWPAGTNRLALRFAPNTASMDSAAGEVLLSFETLSDSLSHSQGAPATPKRTNLRVEYLLFTRGDTYDLVRRERSGNATSNLTLFSMVEPVRLEFHDGTAWQMKWTLATRPRANRLFLNQKTCVIAP